MVMFIEKIGPHPTSSSGHPDPYYRSLDFSIDLSSHLVFSFGSLLRDFLRRQFSVPVSSL
jgi:hypothetical protein